MRSNVLLALITTSVAVALGACDGGGNDTTISGGPSGDDDDDASGDDDDDATGDDDDDDTSPGGNEAPEPNPDCAITDNIADDLEGMETLIPNNGNRQGAWYTYNDGTAGAKQEPPAMDPSMPFIQTTSTAARGLYSARTSGEGFTEWGAGFGFDLNNEPCELDPDDVKVDPECPDNGRRMPYDGSQYEGVSFYIRSMKTDIVVEFKVPTVAETPIAEFGTCDPDLVKCSDSYFKLIDVAPTWTLVRVPFADLSQGTWGEPYAWDPTNLLGLQWQVGKDEPEFDVAVDEVCFF